MKKVSVVTVNYNTEQDTKNLIASLKKVRTPNFLLTIIVVDNGSKNVSALDSLDNITLIKLKENSGFTGGYNTGMKKALQDGADYVMIVNNDTTADPDLISNLLDVLEKDKHIGVTVPKIYFAKGHEFHKDRYKEEELGKVFWYAGGHTDWDHVKSVHRGVDEVDHGQYDTLEKVTFATGCCMMFKKEVLEKVGFFDERYFLYYEAADLNERVIQEGYTIYYVPSAVLYHANASSTGGAGSSLQDYFMTRNQMLFGLQYAPLRTKAALMRQSMRLRLHGRPEQKQGIRDFYLGRFGRGTFFNKK